MNKTALLIGGLGLGAGLIYMLDPERGERRRAMARTQLERYRRQTDDLWDHTTRRLGHHARALVARTLYGTRRRYDVYARSQAGQKASGSRPR